jgi:hypothetical protein
VKTGQALRAARVLEQFLEIISENTH